MTRTDLKDILVRIETGLPFDARALLPLLTELYECGGLESIKDSAFEQGYDSGLEDAGADLDD